MLDQASGKPLATGQTREQVIAFRAVFDNIDTKDIRFAKQTVKNRPAQLENFPGRIQGFITDSGHQRIQEPTIAFGVANRQIFDDRFDGFLDHIGGGCRCGCFIDIVHRQGNHPFGQNTTDRRQRICKHARHRRFTKQTARNTRVPENLIRKVLDRLCGILDHFRRDDFRNRLINRLHFGKNILNIRRVTTKQTAQEAATAQKTTDDTIREVFDSFYNVFNHLRRDNIRHIRCDIPEQVTNDALVAKNLIRKVLDRLCGILNHFRRDDFRDFRNRRINRLNFGKNIFHIRCVTAEQTTEDTVFSEDTIGEVFDSLYDLFDHFRRGHICQVWHGITKQVTNDTFVSKNLIREILDCLDDILDHFRRDDFRDIRNRLINRLNFGKNIFNVRRVTAQQTAQQTTDDTVFSEDTIGEVFDSLYDLFDHFRRGHICQVWRSIPEQVTDDAFVSKNLIREVLDCLDDILDHLRRDDIRHIRNRRINRLNFGKNILNIRHGTAKQTAQQTTDDTVLTENTIRKVFDRFYNALNHFRRDHVGHIRHSITEQTTNDALVAKNLIHKVFDCLDGILDHIRNRRINRLNFGKNIFHIRCVTTKQTAQQTTDDTVFSEDTIGEVFDSLDSILDHLRRDNIRHIRRDIPEQVTNDALVSKNLIGKVFDSLYNVLNHFRRDDFRDIRNRLVNRLHFGKNIFRIRCVTAKQTAQKTTDDTVFSEDTIREVFDSLYDILNHFRRDHVGHIRHSITEQTTNDALVAKNIIHKILDRLDGTLDHIRNRLINRLHFGKNIFNVRRVTAKQAAQKAAITEHRIHNAVIAQQATDDAILPENRIRKVFDSLYNVLNHFRCSHIRHIRRVAAEQTTQKAATAQHRIHNAVIAQQATDDAILSENRIRKVFDSLYDILDHFRCSHIRSSAAKQTTQKTATAQHRIDNTVVAQQTTDDTVLPENRIREVFDRLYNILDHFRCSHIRRVAAEQAAQKATITKHAVNQTVVTQQATDDAILPENRIRKVFDSLYNILDHFRCGHIRHIRSGAAKQAAQQTTAQHRIDHAVITQQASDDTVFTKDTIREVFDSLYNIPDQFLRQDIRGGRQFGRIVGTAPEETAKKRHRPEQPANATLLTRQTAQQAAITKQATQNAVFPEDAVNQTVITQKSANQPIITKEPANQTVFAKDTVNQTVIAQKPADNPVVAKHRVNQTIISENGIDNTPVAEHPRKDAVFAGEHVHHAILAQNGTKNATLAEQTTQDSILTENTANQTIIAQDTVQDPINQAVVTKDPANQTIIAQDTVQNPIDQTVLTKDPANQTIIAQDTVQNPIDQTVLTEDPANQPVIAKDTVQHPIDQTVLAKDPVNQPVITKDAVQNSIDQTVLAEDSVDQPVITQKPVHNPVDQTAVAQDTVNQTAIAKKPAENAIDQPAIAKHRVDQTIIPENGIDNAAIAQNTRKDAILADDRIDHAILAQNGAKQPVPAEQAIQQVVHKTTIADDRIDNTPDNAILTQKAADHPLIVRADILLGAGISAVVAAGLDHRSGQSTPADFGLHRDRRNGHCIRNGNNAGRICLAAMLKIC
ncbi:hypothetical protein ACFQFQ_04080 [Sulfitobacter porphyrae]|uniref:Uncharacterized protein n=1 Tax=Sulfitobacter porphyrae TaxID=1246864 RepID=A0ABW2AZY9_9RHOB